MQGVNQNDAQLVGNMTVNSRPVLTLDLLDSSMVWYLYLTSVPYIPSR